MKYLEWNHVISRYLFNNEKAGKEVLLYITQQEISLLGMKSFDFSDKDESWSDYCKALKNGFPEIHNKHSFLDKFNVINNKWSQYEKWIFEKKTNNDLKIEEISIKNENGTVPPFYLAFLITLVIPLTENPNQYRANAYYPRLNEFLKENNIAQPDVKSLSFSYDIWDNLEKWSKHFYQTDYGFFEKRNFGSPKWIHVGTPFSQCILSPQNIRNTPNLFWAAELVPNSTLTNAEIINILKSYGQKELNLSRKILDIIEDPNDEITKVIIDIVRREYEKWEGDVYENEIESSTGRIKSGWVSAVLYSAFNIDSVNDEWDHQYYIYSKNEYPEDLNLLGQNISYLANGYSRAISLPFNQNLIAEDNFNKWKVAPKKNDLILYRNGAYAGLENDVWIETSEISRASQMYLLCKADKKESIDNWGKHFTPQNFKQINLEGIPIGHILYRFKNPTIQHIDEPSLRFQATKKIELSGGLKINNREFLQNALPAIYLRGGIGTEKVYLEYTESGEQLFLTNNSLIPERYNIPDSVQHNKNFLIKIKDEELAGYTIPYKIIETAAGTFLLNENKISKRNKFGEPTIENDDAYILGSNTIYNRWAYQQGWTLDFFSINYTMTTLSEYIPNVKNEDGNLLLEYLSCQRETTYENFCISFDTLTSDRNVWENISNEVKWIKQLAIKFYDFLGHLDYEYSTGKININKPQIVIIPSSKSVVAILIGARTRNNVLKLIEVATKLCINVEIKDQDNQLLKYLLPDTIYLTPAECKNSTEAIHKIDQLASDLNIIFKKVERPEIKPAIIQFGLQDFSATISEYKQHMLSNNLVNEKDHSWAARVFNTQTLRFEKLDGKVNTNLSLVLYVFKYKKLYRFWYHGKSYNIDENWGTYLIASERQRKVIFYSQEQWILAVPRNMQLPRLISESLILLSGRAPSFKTLQIDNNKIVYQLYENVPKLFAENLFQKFNQEIQPLNM
ncbi:hypothetical protein [Chitinophaga sp. sic0106]|uniref:hypothetical protein n=1 Tax=Chitinophaga sp. sic0106 TaxID=2854785 RepID=UPI001C447F04|nr:hypothetical protein [Chitinophaga sp. sic0106]MBV7530468.1 hypothetical protein [Chitinophaga sp. sic0106]